MALNSTNRPIRWKERIGTWFKFSGEVLGSYLGFRRGDDLQKRGVKTADLVARRATYFVADHYINGLHLSIGGLMVFYGWSFLLMWVGIWVFDFIVASSFIFFYLKTGKDISTGSDMRRAADTAQKRSRVLGFLIMLGNIVLAIVWSGPEKVVTFFRKEIGTAKRIVVFLIVLTAIQSLIWANLYYFALGWVIKHLK